MAWQKYGRNNYYYRGIRQDGRVDKVYFGRGSLGAVAADLDAQEQLQRELRAAERTLVLAADGPVLQLVELTQLLLEATLYGAGFQQHDRGEWRRRSDRSKP